ncbi:hypothetical protein JOF41_004771 [Saccharothrix coeruleofusca]|uniref:DUF6297 family protein n=1 Tax=Saccharothrix coeruleofusca TaxID=33919 RepID=UPI001AE8C4CB|nr:DUF6297 family protein [Saccharothrix coeruleofusca]MBP2338593.1 hypothetical protein [Saccharothrix coeruleofusca]
MIRLGAGWRDRDQRAVLIGLIVIGSGMAVQLVRSALARPPAGASDVPPGWLSLATAASLIGVATLVLTATGPLVASPATVTWLLTTPLDRRAAVKTWYRALTAVGALAGVALGLVLSLLFHLGTGWAALLGGAVGGGLVALAALAQIRREPWRWLPGVTLTIGVLSALAGVVAERLGDAARDLVGGIGANAGSVLPAVAAVAAPAAIVLIGVVDRRLGELARPELTSGAAVTAAAATAGTFLDVTLLTGVLEVRRWQRRGRVRSRGLPAGRTRALLVADLRRISRSPGIALSWLLVALVPYVVVVEVPQWAAQAQLVTACVASHRLAGGLRAVCRSAALRRALGGTDASLRVTHLVVPAAGALVWCALTAPATWGAHPLGWLVAAVGAVATTYRLATRPPMDYHATLLDIGFGVMIPWGLLRQLFRGAGVLLLFSILMSLLTGTP